MPKPKLFYVRIFFKDGGEAAVDLVEDYVKEGDKVWVYVQGDKRGEKYVNVKDILVRESETPLGKPSKDKENTYTTDREWSKMEVVKTVKLYCDEKCFDWIDHDVHYQNDAAATEYRYCQKCHTHTTWRRGYKDPRETRYEDRARPTFDFKRNNPRTYRKRGGGGE